MKSLISRLRNRYAAGKVVGHLNVRRCDRPFCAGWHHRGFHGKPIIIHPGASARLLPDNSLRCDACGEQSELLRPADHLPWMLQHGLECLHGTTSRGPRS